MKKKLFLATSFLAVLAAVGMVGSHVGGVSAAAEETKWSCCYGNSETNTAAAYDGEGPGVTFSMNAPGADMVRSDMITLKDFAFSYVGPYYRDWQVYFSKDAEHLCPGDTYDGVCLYWLNVGGNTRIYNAFAASVAGVRGKGLVKPSKDPTEDRGGYANIDGDGDWAVAMDAGSGAVAGETQIAASFHFTDDGDFYKLETSLVSGFQGWMDRFATNAYNINQEQTMVWGYIPKSALTDYVNDDGTCYLHFVCRESVATDFNVYDLASNSTLDTVVSALHMSSTTEGQCDTLYEGARRNYFLLSETDKTTFKTSNTYVNERARYEAWSTAHGVDPYNAEAPSSNLTSFIYNDNSLIIIVACGVIALASIGFVFFSKKKATAK